MVFEENARYPRRQTISRQNHLTKYWKAEKKRPRSAQGFFAKPEAPERMECAAEELPGPLAYRQTPSPSLCRLPFNALNSTTGPGRHRPRES